MALSPGINITEKDITTYTTVSNDTMLAIVGYASKGPIGVPTLITSKTKFIETFGTPPENSPYSGITAYNAFNYTDRMVFYRITDGTESPAEAVVVPSIYAKISYATPATITGVTGEVGVDEQAEGDFIFESTTGLTITVGTKVGTISFTTTANASMTRAELFELIKAQISLNPVLYKEVKVELTDNKIVFTALNPGMTPFTVVDAGLESNLHLSLGGDTADDLTEATPTTIVATARKAFSIKAKELGSATNLISVVKSSRKSVTDKYTLIHTIKVYLNGKLKETFDNLVMSFSLTEGSTSFMRTISDTSDYIEFAEADTTSTFPSYFPDGTYNLGASNYGAIDVAYNASSAPEYYTYRQGTDGIPTDQTTVRSKYIAALAIDGDLGNDELYDFHLLTTPDTQDEVVQDAAIALAESRKDFMYIADTPFEYSYIDAINWHNGDDTYRTNQLVSSYAATYAPWVKITNPGNGEATWVPPSVVISSKLLEIDKLYGPWAAPAGDTRGVLTGVSDYEYSPSKAQRDDMYGDPNTINPIVFFNTKGIEVYGEKTCLREEGKAMSRIHVRRLVIFLAKLLKKSLDSFIYESNSPATWAKASERLNAILDGIRNKGGLSTYEVIVDNTNNDAQSILENAMNVIIKIVPFGAIESIEVVLSVDMTGATIVA